MASVPDEGTALALEIPAAQFDYARALGFLRARAVPAIERFVSDGFERVLRTGTGIHLLSVRGTSAGAVLRLVARTEPEVPMAELRGLITRLFDLDADLAPFRRLARLDLVLRLLVAARPGLRLVQILDPFEAAVRGILGQQVSVAAASTMTSRVATALGDPFADGLIAFPTPARVAEAGTGAMTSLGITKTKSRAIVELATRSVDGRIDWDELRGASEARVVEVLTQVPGVGPWTARYLQMRALSGRDALPVRYLGLVKALLARGVAERDHDSVTDRWRPWRGYAVLHLWSADA
ncbi:MAG: AlkA N-terminal domain-containing protein [Gemmatimonadota bacterium]